MKRLFLLLVVAAAAWAAFCVLVPIGPDHEAFLDITPGTPSMQIAAKLKQQGLIRSQDLFEGMHLIKGGSLKAGYYRFDHPAKMSEVMDRLRRGDVYTVNVTIPEGSNVFDIAQKLEAAHFGTKEQFVAAVKMNAQLIADLDPGAKSLEGYLFPDTYKLSPKATDGEILATMVRRFRAAAASLPLTGDDHRVVTMASLIERETPIDTERPLVASVFQNRLAKDMPLMTDPTVIYAALLEGRYRGTIYASDLAADSAYNTYRHAGLPPGPICNPGIVSLRAAMHPAQTNYLYFVAGSANPSGVSKFSATLEEHARDVQAYRKAVKEAEAR